MKAHFLPSTLLLSLAVFFVTNKLITLKILLLFMLGLALYFFKTLWFNTWRVRRNLELQGIKGPKPSLLCGNAWEMQRIQASLAALKKNDGEFVAHDYTANLFPYFEQWRKEYGPVYAYSTGNKQHLYINHPQLVKEMNQCNSSELGKPSYITKRLAPMLGNGILRSNGHTWAQQRKIVAPEFFMEKVKGMMGLMVESAESLSSKWDDCIQLSEGCKVVEIQAEEYLRSVTADVISRACFGSSYLKGKQIYSKLRTLQKLICNQGFLFGSHAFGLLPIGKQRKIEHLEKEIESLIWEAAQEREKESYRHYHDKENKDLLQLILEGAINNNVSEDSHKRFIVDNCKNIYFAGHESTAVAASWCLMLLALHPQWQDQIRAEVAQVCGDNGGVLDSDLLHKLKTVTMVIHEVLRLYPPAAFISREALQDTQIGHLLVPKGVCLWTLIPTLHRDPEIWGPDVNDFNPQRFANGVSNACKVPQVYIPFGLGPRLCLGKNFALVQLKILITVIVSKFSFSLSPKYRHCPAYRMLVEPGQGVQLLVRRHV